jgi:hypothetical protein
MKRIVRVGLWPPLPAAQNKKPNVVIILADNVGYGDIGAYGAGEIRSRYRTSRFNRLSVFRSMCCSEFRNRRTVETCASKTWYGTGIGKRIRWKFAVGGYTCAANLNSLTRENQAQRIV